MLCGDLDGNGVWGRMDTCIYMTESLLCSPETITTLFVDQLCVCVCVCACARMHTKSLQSYTTLCDTMDCVARQAPLSMGFSRQEYWSGLPCSPLQGSSGPRIEPMSLLSPALAGGFFTTRATWETLISYTPIQN